MVSAANGLRAMISGFNKTVIYILV
jgi:hypothetical protein